MKGIQKKQLHHTMSQKKGEISMNQDHIRVTKEAGESYSFAVGDEMRKSLITPWRLPLLPISLIRRIAKHRKKILEDGKINSLTDCLFIFDLEKMRLSDQKSFANQALNYSNNSIGVAIGEALIQTDYKHFIQTRKQLSIPPKDWNLMLETFLLGIVRSYRPEKIVFVGKYPYAGVMSVLRKCEPKQNFYWIHVRGEAGIVKQRSIKFNLTKEISFFTDQDTIVRNTIYFDYQPSKKLVNSLKKNGINIIRTIEHAEYISLKQSGYDFKGMLMKNQTLFLNSENEKDLGFIPDYLLRNLVTTAHEDNTEIIDAVTTYRKDVNGKNNSVMTVEAKLDLWFN